MILNLFDSNYELIVRKQTKRWAKVTSDVEEPHISIHGKKKTKLASNPFPELHFEHENFWKIRIHLEWTKKIETKKPTMHFPEIPSLKSKRWSFARYFEDPLTSTSFVQIGQNYPKYFLNVKFDVLKMPTDQSFQNDNDLRRMDPSAKWNCLSSYLDWNIEIELLMTKNLLQKIRYWEFGLNSFSLELFTKDCFHSQHPSKFTFFQSDFIQSY